MQTTDRRTAMTTLAGMAAMAAAPALAQPNSAQTQASSSMPTPELIIRNARIATLDRQNPQATAVAMGGGRFLAVGSQDEVMRLATPTTRVIDAKGKRIIPGLIDSHIHVIRGGAELQP